MPGSNGTGASAPMARTACIQAVLGFFSILFLPAAGRRALCRQLAPAGKKREEPLPGLNADASPPDRPDSMQFRRGLEWRYLRVLRALRG